MVLFGSLSVSIGTENPADMFTKYLEPYKLAKITSPLLHWQGDLPEWPPVVKKRKIEDTGDN